MLFIVPDADAPPSSRPSTNGAAAAPVAKAKEPAVKVELDLDDAPFLEEPPAEEAKPEAPPPPTAPAPVQAAPAAKLSLKDKILAGIRSVLTNKKRLLIFGGGALALLLGAALTLVLLTQKPPPPPPPQPQARRIVVDGTPPEQPAAPAGPRFLYTFEYLFVPLRGTEGELRFLRCKFTIPTDNPLLNAELEVKKIALRDSLYYYLHNKDIAFLTDPKLVGQLKEDMISVINERVSTEKVKDLYFEDLLVTGS